MEVYGEIEAVCIALQSHPNLKKKREEKERKKKSIIK